MKFGSEDVAQYLKQHPQFFDEYADMLSDIYVPHPHGGRAIPISQRQIVTLRDNNQILQDKLCELVKFGEENDVIGEKMHHLSIMLLTFPNLNDLLNGLNSILQDNFSIPYVELRLWNIDFGSQEISKFINTSTEIHTMTNSLLNPYCGPQLTDEVMHWFGDGTINLRSFSMIPLKTKRTIGLLVLASEEPQRFYPEMGTLYLQRIGELISTAISRYSPAECNK